jgi:hypothetical protein
MPQLRFKNFSDLGFIQRVDKPQFMVPLLKPHKDYFAKQGLDVEKLKNGDGHDRKLLEVFTSADEAMPPELLEKLYMLDDLADEAGHDRILAEAERQGVQLNGILGEDLSPGELAIAVHLQHTRIVRLAHERTIFRKIKNYEEYQGTGTKQLTLKAAKTKCAALEADLAPWFESKNRSRACEIYVYEEKDDIKFEITHGRPYRTDGTIDKKLRRSRIAWRPQKHDSVVYDTSTGVLKLNAQTPGEKDLYRKAFGKILFDDADYFPDGDIYTLAPLRKPKPTIALVAGIESARLTEIWNQIDAESGFVQTSRAYNLLAEAEKRGNPNFAQGKIVRASFLIKYRSGGRPRKLELRPPNVAIYDRARDGEPAEEFMRANEFSKLPKPSKS